jgi:hypothetical protein
VVECIGDHVRLLDDLPNGVALAQEIVAGSVLLVTEILAIEDDKLNSTFVHVAFGSQSMLEPNGSQSKFLSGSWPISQDRPDPKIDPTPFSSNSAKIA